MSRRRARPRSSDPVQSDGWGRRSAVSAAAAGLFLAAIALASCDDPTPLPTAPEDDAPIEEAPPTASLPPSGQSVFSDRAHPLSGDEYELISTAEEMEVGQYRFRGLDVTVEAVPRDDFVILETPEGEVRVRRVLTSRVEGGELILDTGPGYWHEIVQGGRYEFSIPLDGTEASLATPAGSDGPSAVSGTLTEEGLPPLEAGMENEDVCPWIQSWLDALPGAKERFGCGEPHEIEKSVFKVSGTLDSLLIRQADVRLTGTFEVFLDIDEGGIEGGSRPVFSPCNRGAYAGCLTTPTGAALIDFLRRYAPAIPDGSLSPNRVCIPGTPIRIARGYWSGWTWVPPRYERCRVASIGTLPTITLPSVREVQSHMVPTVAGSMTVRVQGDGAFALEVPIPSLGVGKKVNFSDYFQVEVKAGVFFLLKAEMRNGGGTARFTLDATSEVDQLWTSTAGWSSDFQLTDGSFTSELLYLDNPDTVAVRLGVPVKLSAGICLGLTACAADDSTSTPDSTLSREGWMELAGIGEAEPLQEDLALAEDGLARGVVTDWLLKKVKVGAGVGAGVSMFYDGIWSREVLNEVPYVDNWHVSVEQAYDLSVNGKVKIPLTGWILPNVPRSFDKTWECCRIPVSDYWGQGLLQVTTETTGTAPDPDGFTVMMERADTFPGLLDPGTTRIGTWTQQVLEAGIDPTGSALFGTARLLPCAAIYSDVLLTMSPVWGLSVAGARAAGVNIPSYGIESPCPWLIARYRVTLGGVSDHCTVSADGPVGVRGGAAQDSVWLFQKNQSMLRGDTTYLHFDVVCDDPGPVGDLRVILPSALAGADPGPSVQVDGLLEGGFAAGDTLLLTDMTPGFREVSLAGVPANCVSDPVSVEVVAGEVAVVEPPAVCAIPDLPPGSVEFLSLASGDGEDGNGFSILLDGEPAAALRPGGNGVVSGIAPQTPVVLNVWDIAGNCQPLATNPRVVTLDAQATPVTVSFPVRCSAAKPDTLVGTVDAQTWPTSSVTFRATDGRTLAVKGPKAAELAALTGTSARIWGTASATDIDVHGYDLRSKLGDDRWMGIVLHRPGDGTWLFGDEAIPLINPPSSLIQASGSLVWVMGVENQGGIQPTLYGVIRGGGS